MVSDAALAQTSGLLKKKAAQRRDKEAGSILLYCFF